MTPIFDDLGWCHDMEAAPDDKRVLVAVRKSDIFVAKNTCFGWASIPGFWRGHPTAWCPLPEAPEPRS